MVVPDKSISSLGDMARQIPIIRERLRIACNLIVIPVVNTIDVPANGAFDMDQYVVTQLFTAGRSTG
jgi:hypothetical protein